MLLKTDNRIFIGLGSNLDDSPGNLRKAIQLLQESFQTDIITSSMYFSEPVEVLKQPWFFNQVAYFEDNNNLTPSTVLRKLQAIEQLMGRVPTYRYGPRIIDLDILLFKNWVYESESLIIPHSKIGERLFVLAPLVELDPALIHPRLNSGIKQLLSENSFKLSRCEVISI